MKSRSNLPPNKASKGARPGVRMRGQLADVYDARGHSTGKLWFQYSAKTRRDVAFGTEIEYLHFLYLESSFDVSDPTGLAGLRAEETGAQGSSVGVARRA
jgi:hypothetical protein